MEINESLSISISLLKDQMTEMLDDRQTVEKVHEMGNTLMQNVYQVASEYMSEVFRSK